MSTFLQSKLCFPAKSLFSYVSADSTHFTNPAATGVNHCSRFDTGITVHQPPMYPPSWPLGRPVCPDAPREQENHPDDPHLPSPARSDRPAGGGPHLSRGAGQGGHVRRRRGDHPADLAIYLRQQHARLGQAQEPNPLPLRRQPHHRLQLGDQRLQRRFGLEPPERRVPQQERHPRGASPPARSGCSCCRCLGYRVDPVHRYVSADKNGDGDVKKTPNYLNKRFVISMLR